MSVRDFSIPNQTAPWEPNALAAYLDAHGYLVGIGGLSTALDPTDPTTVLVRADLDDHIPDQTIKADLLLFAPDADPKAEAQVELRKAVVAIRSADGKGTTEERLARLESLVLSFATTMGV